MKQPPNQFNCIREPLTSDLIFKAVYGQDNPKSKAALIAMLNLVLERKEDPITDLAYKNPFSIEDMIQNKAIVMDIRAETSAGELLDIEMQMDTRGDFVNRIIIYGCKMASKGLERGEKYAKMKKSILVTFAGTKMFTEEESVHTMFTLKERITNRELSKILQFHFIDLEKIPWKEKRPQELSELEKFGAYLRCSGNPERQDYVEELVRTGGEVISMTDELLKKVSEDERLREARWDRERYELDHALRETEALERGLEQGLKQGRSEGKRALKENQREIALKMKRIGMTFNEICQCTGLSKEEIEAL